MAERRLQPEAKARFLREARLLSNLNHPMVCVVYDFLEVEDNDILVLELVEGQNLRTAMRAGLGEGEKLEIARQLIEVLVAVHAQGVIHRDLKPENVMVGPEGRIKVLDFGLAREIGAEAAAGVGGEVEPQDILDSGATMVFGEGRGSDETAESGDDARVEEDRGVRAASRPEPVGEGDEVGTTAGTVLGTVGYMSPEQARGEHATAASDMYSLGLILQELFTGRAPFAPGLDRRVLLARTARGESPEVEGLSADLTELINRLKSFAPGARPSSVDAAAMLQRILDRPKRRRRQMIIAAVWLVLGLFAAGMTVQSIRAARAAARALEEASRAEAEARRAEVEAETARQVSEFLTSIFRVSDPGEARGNEVLARELLDRGAERIEDELVDQPQVQARLLDSIGGVYQALGLYQQSEALFRQALDKRRELFGEEHVHTAASLHNLGVLLLTVGQLEQAEPLLTRARELTERHLGPYHPQFAKSLTSLGNLYFRMGRFAEAESVCRRALEINERVFGADDRNVAMSLDLLAVMCREQGKFEEAERVFRRELAILEKALGPDHPRVSWCINGLANLCADVGRYEEAARLHQRALAIRETNLDPEHPLIAQTLFNIASLWSDLGRFDEAEPLLLRMRSIQEKALQPDNPDRAWSLVGLARLYTVQGRYPEAVERATAALELRTKALGTGHFLVYDALMIAAQAYSSSGQFARAEELFRRSLEVGERAFGADHPDVAAAACQLALVEQQRGELDAAERLLDRVFSVLVPMAGAGQLADPQREHLAMARVCRGNVFAARGDRQAAREQWSQAVETIQPIVEVPGRHDTIKILATALLSVGRIEEARDPALAVLRTGDRDPTFLELCQRFGVARDSAS